MMKRHVLISLLLASVVAAVAATAGVKIAGETMLPSELVFMEAETRSQAHAEGTLANGCKWEARAVTRLAPFHSASCVEYFYRTTIVLTKRCPAPDKPQVVLSERTTSTGRHCAGDDGEAPEPRVDVRPVSTGRTPDGSFQDIVSMPDGSRVIVAWNDKSAEVRVTYPDRTTDVVRLPKGE